MFKSIRAMFVRTGFFIFGCLAVVGTAGADTRRQTAKLPDWSGAWQNISGVFTEPEREDKSFLPPNTPPLNAEYAAKYQASLDSRKAGRPINDPTASCLWPGMPRIAVSPYPLEFLFTPGRVTILYEYMSQTRRIRTDGSKHPDGADLEPSYNGDSIGHWEGDTLVVDTVGLRDDTMYEHTGLPHSDALHIVERYHLNGQEELLDEMTFIDPKVFTRPWTSTTHYRRHRDWAIHDFVCEENNRSPLANGDTVDK